MHSTRRAAAAAVSVSLALTGVAAAHADGSPVLYVDGSSTACTNSGSGTAAAPYCSIQAAADAAVAGDTVDIAPGTYTGQVDIKSVGTAAAPIVFEINSGNVIISDASGQTGPALSFDGAAYVSLEGTYGLHEFITNGVEVNGSSHVTLNGLDRVGEADVAGTSSNVTLTRSYMANVQVDAGSSGDVISTNFILGSGSQHGVSISGASNTDITSNDIWAPVGQSAISITDASTGTSIENNIAEESNATASTDPAPVPAATVDAASAPGTTLDYNVVYQFGATASEQGLYSWAGTGYSSAAALKAATGQGRHDSNANPAMSGIVATVNTAPAINSANSSAPGMLNTDPYGNACTGDPLAPVTGAGQPAYCERGAIQQVYKPAVTTTATTVAHTALGVDLTSGMSEDTGYYGGMWAVSSAPTPAVSYTVNWGDGQIQTVQGSSTTAITSTPHTYTRAGTYTITDTANLTTGKTVSTTTTVATSGSSFTPVSPRRIMDARNGTGGLWGYLYSGTCYGLQVTGVDGIPVGATAVAVNLTVTNTLSKGLFYLGSPGASNLNYSAGQTVANSAIVPLPADGDLNVCSEGDSNAGADAILDVTGYFTQTTGADFQPTTQQRVLDTRSGTGAPKAKVGAKSGLTVQITGQDSIPSDAAAVAVHITETNATGNGWIAAEPAGAGVPTTSSLDYAKGQTISNTVIVPVADGKIELYNGSPNGSVDLIADISGYFSANAPDAFMPVTPYRAIDTRRSGSKIASDTSASFPLDSTLTGTSAEIPANAALVVNLTTTDETAGGSLIAYPTGSTKPSTSALNFGKGQNIAGFGLFATTGSTDSISAYNDSPGSTDLVVDVFGYFTNS